MSLAGLHKLALLNMEGCPVTAACLESLSGYILKKCLAFILIIVKPWSVIFITELKFVIL